MEETNKILISCIRAALRGESVDCDVEKCISLAYRHGVLNLLYYAIAKSDSNQATSENVKESLKRQTIGAVVREAIQQQKLEEIYRRFEASKIRCVALKGSVIKSLYPKREMRYMSDLDILIDATKADIAHGHMLEMGCTAVNYNCGDTDAYRCAQGLNFEIKRTLAPEHFNERTKLFLENILSYAQPMEGYRYVCALPNEEHYAYILCHIVKHMLNGGVGVRPIMDVWICKKQMQFDSEKLAQLLEKLKLRELANRVEHLADVWFGDAAATPMDDELGEYILSSGSFGTEEHRVADRMIKGEHGKSKFTYMWSRFFLPYSTMRNYYPVLRKWAILLPLFWIWRAIYALLFRRSKLKEEVGAVSDTNKELLQNRLDFYRRCGINTEEK